MKDNRDAGLERIKQLEEEVARAPVNSGQYRQLVKAIRIEAHLYRKSLDTEQAEATHDARSALLVAGLPPRAASTSEI